MRPIRDEAGGVYMHNEWVVGSWRWMPFQLNLSWRDLWHLIRAILLNRV
jgi:hypothetical protein